MRKMSLMLLAVAGVSLILAGQTSGQTRPAAADPIELTNFKLHYLIRKGDEDPVWKEAKRGLFGGPFRVRASALQLRFTASINREPGTKVKMTAIVHQICFPNGKGKDFVRKLVKYNDNLGNGGKDTEECLRLRRSEPEEVTVTGDKTISTLIVVHCDCCPTPSCDTKRCKDDKEHLGQGPYDSTITAEDSDPALNSGARRTEATTPPRPFMVRFSSKC